MFVDYDYYTNNFKGKNLTSNEFDKFGQLACMYITANTLSRITENSINTYPVEIQSNAKNCTCVLAEYLKKIDDTSNSISGDGASSEGIVKSKTAGAVSVTYDTSLTTSYYLNPANQEQQKQAILRQYLSPICVSGRMFNPLSKVIGVG